MIVEIVVPDIGEGVATGKVVALHIKINDTIKVDDTVLELETDKAVVEIPSPVGGKVTEVLVREGDEIKIGGVIARVESGEAAQDPPLKAVDAKERPAGDTQAAAVSEKAADEDRAMGRPRPRSENAVKGEDDLPAPSKTGRTEAQQGARGRLVAASPSIRRMAREMGVDIHDLKGSGPGGRISEADIKTFVKTRLQSAAFARNTTAGMSGEPVLPDFNRWGETEIVELETVRRLTAESTAASWHAVPHVTQFDKADITGLDSFIKKNADHVAKAGGKLTVTAILAKLCAEALKRYPRFNASIDMQRRQLIFKRYIHIGIAVDTPRGLFMPVITDADTKSISVLSAQIVDLARRARNKQIKPAELEGGTFSISNQGGIGGVGFTPIVLWPQVAILGVSRSSVEAVAEDGQFVARRMLPLSLSYDHRAIDGADAARFLRWICQCLEQPLTLHLD